MNAWLRNKTIIPIIPKICRFYNRKGKLLVCDYRNPQIDKDGKNGQILEIGREVSLERAEGVAYGISSYPPYWKDLYKYSKPWKVSTHSSCRWEVQIIKKPKKELRRVVPSKGVCESTKQREWRDQRLQEFG